MSKKVTRINKKCHQNINKQLTTSFLFWSSFVRKPLQTKIDPKTTRLSLSFETPGHRASAPPHDSYDIDQITGNPKKAEYAGRIICTIITPLTVERKRC